jgi:CRP-like cAMP-binding protein
MTATPKNMLLSVYRAQTGRDLVPRFEPVSMPIHSVLVEAGDRPRYVHLVTSGVVSIVSAMSAGEAVEVGIWGNEGFPECTYLLGPQIPARRYITQVGGTALRMGFHEFEHLFHSDVDLQRLVYRCIQYEAYVVSQLVACNGLHQIEERLARWLLMVQDRTDERELPLTQEFLSQMLGTRRSSVTLAAGNLQRSGIIEYHRGAIRVEDRERMEQAACECYPVVHRFYQDMYHGVPVMAQAGDGARLVR